MSSRFWDPERKIVRVSCVRVSGSKWKYILYTDASDTCIGAYLMQPCDEEIGNEPFVRNEKPIYYLSHRLSDTQTRWFTIEKKAFAIYFALQKLHHYLHGAEFTIRTDHGPLQYILEGKSLQNKKIQCYTLRDITAK